MSETTKSYRVKANVGADSFISVGLEQDYESLDILSLKIKSEDVYRLHNSNYGVIVGRVLANNGFGVPNAKISIFIEKDSMDEGELAAIYPYKTATSTDENGVRYNLLPDEKVDNCHQVVGTFPNKRYLLDNDAVIEMYDKYYKYTTRTNNAGDYMLCGVPTGNQTLHMDLDLSDCGILSQRPRDFVYKGYTVEQFENPNMFKTGTSYTSLSQIFTQNQAVYVQPFWGNDSLGETIGITRADIDIAFKFEPTCVFMGCLASDNSSQGISKKGIPTPHMGDMDELVAGEGTIEMIRKTYAGSVEEFQVKGTELINGDGIWCYQIPMNLDYMMTDEYGNMVPTDNPDKGIPTRTRVRFRISMQDFEENTENYFRPKVLVPHNPQNLDGIAHEDYDYEFGTYTKDESFRDLFWNEVYTVKSYIPRFQKRKTKGWKEEKFTGIKHCQEYGKNNPIPYNNIRIRLPFMFTIMCILIKIFIKVVSVVNTIISLIGNVFARLGDTDFAPVLRTLTTIVALGPSLIVRGIRKIFGIEKVKITPLRKLYEAATKLKMNVIEGLCPDLENWYFAPMFRNNLWVPKQSAPNGMEKYDLLKQTLDSIDVDDDPMSIDDQNQDDEDTAKCLTVNTDYLISCIEMNLAQEYKVINFDFYNDWINGLIYIPRFMRYIRKKRKFLGITIAKAKVRGCMDDPKVFSKTRRYTQLCSLGFKKQGGLLYDIFSKVQTNLKNNRQIVKSNNLHKKRGLTQEKIFGKKNGGICHEKETMYGQHVYYFKPCEWTKKGTPANRKINLFATDLVLLGSLNDCDPYGIPQAFKHLTSSSYIMPTNLALTNMEENGPLYAYGDKGTICSKTNQTTSDTSLDRLMDPINVVDGGATPLTDELNYYSGASSNYDVVYDDPSDTIAMTEAAGIAWNYTGPGQGKINKKKLYYPGGHFLGISCTNSQTNIKSCINLERICELGASMSQRKEDVRAVTDDGHETVLEYTYNVPTGLISGDDIIDDEFRTMFATMNKNRLLANKINPNTGYRVYEFSYINPVNFSGEFAKYAGTSSPYNSPAENVTDESETLRRFGIEDAENRPDYDPNEEIYTIRRTIEFPSVDYYMFRLGLDYSDLKKNNGKHLRQFATDKDGAKYLPQYENSFYFYFGLRNGATALDEFNKQFFSKCDDSTLIERESTSYIVVTDFDYCNGTADVLPFITNMDGELVGKIEFGENTVSRNGNETLYFKWDSDSDIEPITGLPAGTFKFTVIDEEGTEISQEFTVGKDAVNAVISSYSFNVPLIDDVLVRTESNRNMYYGGYVKAEDVVVNCESATDIRIVAVGDGENPYFTNGESVSVSSANTADLYLSSSNTIYDVFVAYKCSGNNDDVYIYLTSTELLNSNSVSLTIGPVLKTPFQEISPSPLQTDWWKQMNNNNGDSRFKWDIRKTVVKANGTSAETFSSSVFAENGLKMIFGTAQNSDMPLYGELHCPEDDETIPDGYTVDDDATYFEDYGVPHYPDMFRYNAMAYTGTTVAGNFAAIVKGGVGFNRVVTSVVGTGLREGEGCIFKPLPDGELIPAEYHQGWIKCLVSNAEDIDEYMEGIVYPTVVYPVVRKPFQANVNYFILQEKALEAIVDDEEDEMSAEIVSYIVGTKAESHIFNGLTYNHYYGGDSYVPVITNEETEDGYETTFRSSVGDLDTVTTTGWTGSSAYSCGWVDEEVDDYSFTIEEGAPMYKKGTDNYSANKEGGYTEYEDTEKYRSVVATADLGVDFNFYSEIKYMIDDENHKVLYAFEGISDSDIKYYIMPFTYLDNILTGAPNDDGDGGYIYVAPAKRTLFILGYYEGAKYDQDGKDVIVKVYDPGLRYRKRVVIPFTDVKDGERQIIYKEEKFRAADFDLNGDYSDIVKRCVNKIKSKFNGRYNVEFRKRTIAVENSKTRIETHSGSWTQTVNAALNNAIEIVDEVSAVPTGDRHAIIGVKHIEGDGIASSNVYMIYAAPTVSFDVNKGDEDED